MASATLTERVRQRLLELKQEKRWRRKDVAARLGVDGSAAGRIITNRDITLAQLEAICAESGVEPAELVAPPGTLKQVNPDEAELLRFVRAWPKSVTQSLLAFLRYFADEAPAETQTRQVHEFWRGLHAGDRLWIHGVLQLLREGMLTPDLREGLSDRLIGEMRKRKGRGATPPGRDNGST